jgi:hypothetical protein
MFSKKGGQASYFHLKKVYVWGFSLLELSLCGLKEITERLL